MKWHPLRWGLRILAVTGIGFAVSFVWVLVASRADERQPADAIVVLGAAQWNGKPSPVFQARLDHAVTLFREHLAPRIVVTGGVGKGDRESEATVARRFLLLHGVPDSAVVVRAEGHTTGESMESAAAWARDHGVHHVLLVSDPFHMARLRLEARRLGLEANTSPTRTSPISSSPRTEVAYMALEAFKVPASYLINLF